MKTYVDIEEIKMKCESFFSVSVLENNTFERTRGVI